MAKKKSTRSKLEKGGRGEDVDFEQVLAEVETIVSKLESGELDLTESLEQYERGVRQLKNCHSILHAAERRVTILSGFDADGNPVLEGMPESESGSTNRSKSGGQKARGDGEDTQSAMDDSPGLF